VVETVICVLLESETIAAECWDLKLISLGFLRKLLLSTVSVV